MRGSIFDTPGRTPISSEWRTQKGAIAAPHQSDAVLDQADGTAAQIVRFPVAIRDATSPEQAFCYFAIAVSLQPPIERAHGQYEPPTPLERQRKRRRAQGALFERRPKSVCRLRADVEICVEWQIDGKQ